MVFVWFPVEICLPFAADLRQTAKEIAELDSRMTLATDLKPSIFPRISTAFQHNKNISMCCFMLFSTNVPQLFDQNSSSLASVYSDVSRFAPYAVAPVKRTHPVLS